jgi:hypothetical protein
MELLEPAGSFTRAHDDPDPRRRVMRRILQRLDGMGKWGGYHTAFDHLAAGSPGTSVRWRSTWESDWSPPASSSRSRAPASDT